MSWLKTLHGCTACIVLIGLFSCRAAAQTGVDIGVDYAAFAYDQSETLVEIYLGIGAPGLPYEQTEGAFTATVPLELGLWHATDAELADTPVEAVWQEAYSMAFSVADTANLAEGQVFVRQVRVAVAPGEYELRVAVDRTG